MPLSRRREGLPRPADARAAHIGRAGLGRGSGTRNRVGKRREWRALSNCPVRARQRRPTGRRCDAPGDDRALQLPGFQRGSSSAGPAALGIKLVSSTCFERCSVTSSVCCWFSALRRATGGGLRTGADRSRRRPVSAVSRTGILHVLLAAPIRADGPGSICDPAEDIELPGELQTASHTFCRGTRSRQCQGTDAGDRCRV